MLIGRRTAIAFGAAATACLAAQPLRALPRLQPEPADLLEIKMLLMRYAWAIDTGNATDAAAVFSRDAVIRDLNGKLWRRTNGGVSSYVRELISAGEPGVQHQVQINRVAPAGGRWLAESYWSQVGWRAGSARPEVLALGAFVDRLAKRDGRWLISERRISPWNSMTVRVPVVEEPGQ